MHDLKFEELIKFKSRKPERERMFRSAACAKANAAFWENIQMIETVAMVPGYAFMNGEDWGISVVRAMTELNSTDPYEKTVQARASKIWDAYDMQGFDQSRIDHFKEATQNAVKMASLPGRNFSFGALLALLKSIVIQSWSAYELLAEQLIKECKASHSSLFSAQILAKRHPVRSERTLPASYNEIFGADVEINNAVWNSGVKAHALLRHLLVHSHGKVDSAHLNQRITPPIVSEWDAYKEGDEIVIDGGIVRILTDRTTESGYALISAVSKWVDSRTK